jgi:predicted transposase/invertase (TIGR01784 family)
MAQKKPNPNAQKSGIAHPHDRFLKALLARPETAGILLHERLPKKIAEALSPDPPQWVEGSFVDEELREYLTDRLFAVKTITNYPAFIYVLVDHKSTPYRKIAWQFLRYMVRALEQWAQEHPRWKHLPPIVPLLVYNGATKWRVPDEFLALVNANAGWRPYLLNFRYTMFNLGLEEDQHLSHNPRLQAWLVAAKYATRKNKQIKIKTFLIEVLRNAPEDFFIIFRYIVETYQAYDEETLREIIRKVQPEEEEKMMSIFAEEKKREGERRGEQRGILKGEQSGILKGTAKTLLRMLTRKFGPTLPTWVPSKLQSADEKALEKWTDQFVFASTLDDVFA